MNLTLDTEDSIGYSGETLISKLLIYEILSKSIWSYGIQLWSINFTQRAQNNILKQITNTPCFTKNSEVDEQS